MQVHHLLTAAVATTAFGLAGIASGQVWEGTTSRDWHVNSNWDNNAVPGPADAVTIPMTANQPQIMTSGEEILSLVVEPGAELEILDGDLLVNSFLTIEANTSTGGEVRLEHPDALLQLGAKLTMEHKASRGSTFLAELRIDAGTVELLQDGEHEIGGNIFVGNAVTEGRLLISNDSTPTVFTQYMDGTTSPATPRYGNVIGGNNASTVELAEDATLVNNVVFEGGMTIVPENGTSTFINARVDANGQGWDDPLTGIVRVLAGQQITLAAGLTIQDEWHESGGVMYRPSWEAVGANAALRFNETAGTCGTDPLVGNFVLWGGSTDPATLCLDIGIEEGLHTSGNAELIGNWQVTTPLFAEPEQDRPFLLYACNDMQIAEGDCPQQ